MAEQASGDRALGANLRKAREAKGWSREALARKADVSVATIARTELYGNLPTLAVLAALARSLDVGVDELLGLSPADLSRAEEPA